MGVIMILTKLTKSIIAYGGIILFLTLLSICITAVKNSDYKSRHRKRYLYLNTKKDTWGLF